MQAGQLTPSRRGTLHDGWKLFEARKFQVSRSPTMSVDNPHAPAYLRPSYQLGFDAGAGRHECPSRPLWRRRPAMLRPFKALAGLRSALETMR